MVFPQGILKEKPSNFLNIEEQQDILLVYLRAALHRTPSQLSFTDGVQFICGVLITNRGMPDHIMCLYVFLLLHLPSVYAATDGKGGLFMLYYVLFKKTSIYIYKYKLLNHSCCLASLQTFKHLAVI